MVCVVNCPALLCAAIGAAGGGYGGFSGAV